VPVYAEDTPDDVAARVFREECIAYPEAIRLFSEGRLRIDGLRVHIDSPAYRRP
jgi:folate-dependent phosphoribosylglycinamide formyltransferase PurN